MAFEQDQSVPACTHLKREESEREEGGASHSGPPLTPLYSLFAHLQRV
jgi:hypothetical protein